MEKIRADSPASTQASDETPPQLPARMRGVNISIESAVPSVAKQVATWGGNCIRINFSVDRGYDETKLTLPDSQALVPYQKGIAALKTFLPVCQDLDVKVVLCCAGIPGRKLDVLWGTSDMNASARANLTQFWKVFAAEFKGNPTIVAYDVFNEPNYPTGKDYMWNDQMLPDSVAAIRAVNPNIWLVVEPGPWGSAQGFANFKPIKDPHVIYSFHDYSPHNYTHQGVGKRGPDKGKLTYPGMLREFDTQQNAIWDKDALAAAVQPAVDFTNKYHVRMIVGEFGVARWAPGREKWLADTIDIFEKNGWDWLFHSVAGWNGWNPTYSPDAPVAMTTEEGGVMSPELEVLIKEWSLNSTQASK